LRISSPQSRMDNDAMMVSGGAILKEIYFSRCPIEGHN